MDSGGLKTTIVSRGVRYLGVKLGKGAAELAVLGHRPAQARDADQPGVAADIDADVIELLPLTANPGAPKHLSQPVSRVALAQPVIAGDSDSLSPSRLSRS